MACATPPGPARARRWSTRYRRHQIAGDGGGRQAARLADRGGGGGQELALEPHGCIRAAAIAARSGPVRLGARRSVLAGDAQALQELGQLAEGRRQRRWLTWSSRLGSSPAMSPRSSGSCPGGQLDRAVDRGAVC